MKLLSLLLIFAIMCFISFAEGYKKGTHDALAEMNTMLHRQHLLDDKSYEELMKENENCCRLEFLK